MNFTAYFDESGTHPESSVVVVAGALARAGRWDYFSQQWQGILTEYGLDYFHMTDFAQRAGPYSGQSDEDRNLLFNRILAIVTMCVEFSVSIAVPVERFNRLFSGRTRRYCGGPYGLAAAACIIDVATAARELQPDADPWISYVFESGAQGTGQVMKLFAANERDPESKEYFRLLSIRFENKRQFLPLQAADIMAYEHYLHYPRQMGTNPRPVRDHNMFALSTIPHRWGHLEEDELKKWARIIALKAASEGLPPDDD